ncbi:YoaK family protein, partial [Acinetobacter baumannii]
MPETSIQQETQSTWVICRDPVLLTMVGGAIDTIGFIALFGFFTAHVTGNLVLAGAALVKGGAGLWIKLAAIPLFIVTVVITKLLIDRSQTKHKTLSYLFL